MFVIFPDNPDPSLSMMGFVKEFRVRRYRTFPKIGRTKASFFDQRGITLAASIILILFVSVSVLSVTTFIVQRFSQTRSKSISSRALYLAQAGIHNALYNFRYNDSLGTGYFPLGQTDVDAANYFVVGGTAADLLMVDTSLAYLGGALTQGQCQAIGNACTNTCNATRDACRAQCDADRDTCRAQADADRDACRAACPSGPSGNACRNACDDTWNAAKALCDAIRNACYDQCDIARGNCRDTCSANESACIDGTKLIDIYLQNATNSKTITIDRMIVTWANTQTLVEININGTIVWTGNLSSPADANLNPNFTLDAVPTIYLMDYLRFSGNMSGVNTSIQFVMTDGSLSENIPVFPASNNNNFIVKSMGKTTASNIYRTIAAKYNTFTGKVIDYREINIPITP